MKIVRMYTDFEAERKSNVDNLKRLVDKYIPKDNKKQAIEKIKAEQ